MKLLEIWKKELEEMEVSKEVEFPIVTTSTLVEEKLSFADSLSETRKRIVFFSF